MFVGKIFDVVLASATLSPNKFKLHVTNKALVVKNVQHMSDCLNTCYTRFEDRRKEDIIPLKGMVNGMMLKRKNGKYKTSTSKVNVILEIIQ